MLRKNKTKGKRLFKTRNANVDACCLFMGLSLSSATSPWRVQDVEKSRFVLQILYIDLDLAPCHFVSSRPVGTWVGTCCQASWSLFCLSLPLLCLLILPPTKIPFSSRNSRIGKLHMIDEYWLVFGSETRGQAGLQSAKQLVCLFPVWVMVMRGEAT